MGVGAHCDFSLSLFAFLILEIESQELNFIFNKIGREGSDLRVSDVKLV
jgi:hypothetical protein